jgi:myosin heavy subunit
MNVDTSAINLLATVVDATEEVCVPQNEQTKSEGTADKNESILEGSGDVVDDARIQNNDVSPKATSCKMSFVGNVDDNDENFDKMDYVGDEGTTQRSQDLLLASPATAETVKSKNFSSSDKPSIQYDASKSMKHPPSNDPGASPPSAQKITKKTPHLTKFVDNRSAEWISSARRGLKTKGEKETDSPRLIVPSFKPIKSSLKDRAEMNEEDVIDDIDEDDGSDDDESWSGHRCTNHGEDYLDPIENTQDESNIMVKPSAFERLSRGSSKSTLEFIPPATNDAMKPKILQYERNDSSSEVEFSHGDDNNSSDDELRQINRKISHLSQTDQRIREQLREVQDILPSVREIQDIATRKQLLDEIAELKTSHKASIKKLTQEKSKLVTQLKTANDTIRQKEQVIKEKNELLEQQFTVISQITGACQTLSSVPSTKRKRTPLESELHGTKSSSDDDDAPISTLKTNRTYSGKSKKMPCASFACSSSTGATKKVKIGLSPVGSDRSSVKDKNDSNLLSGSIWKKLQEKGWRYMCGPEPYNKGM